MSETQIDTAVKGSWTTDDSLDHYYCECDPDLALCGADLTAVDESLDGQMCVVCEDLEAIECQTCGF